MDFLFLGEKAIFTPIEVPVTVSYKNPKKTCVDNSFEKPIMQCDVIEQDYTMIVPAPRDDEVVINVCKTKLGPPSCQEKKFECSKNS